MKYKFIQDNPEYPVKRWAKMLKIEQSGYYAWLKNRRTLEKKEGNLKKKIKKVFDESRGTYGPGRIIAQLRKEDEHLGHKRCAKYMAEINLSSCHNKHRIRSLTNSKGDRGDGYPNILRDQEFPIVPRMVVTNDITYLRTGEGLLYTIMRLKT